MLALIAPVHRERLGFFRALIVELADARDLAAVIVDEGGYPVLSVSRVDGTRSMTVRCVYWEGAWFFDTTDALRFERAGNIPGAALFIEWAMRL